MRIKHLGIFGIVILLSYTAMVVFSPMAYPGYNWLSMAVSELSAQGAPSAVLAARLNALTMCTCFNHGGMCKYQRV